MADNTRLNAGTTGDYIRTDDINGVKTQVVKIDWGGEGQEYIGESFQSTNNTTTDTLAADATYTGTGEQSPFPWVGVNCQTSTSGTLFFDFSVDDSNWSTYPSNGYTVNAGVNEFHTALVLGRYFRVRFVNGSTEQTYFRLYTYYGNFAQPIAPLNQAIGPDADAILVRVCSDPDQEYASGLIDGTTVVNKFGRNSAVGTTYVPITSSGFYRTPQVGSATTLRVKAGNGNDTAGGTGARSVTLVMIDENGDEQTEILATAGESASSATTTTAIRLTRLYVEDAGSYPNVGTGSHAANVVVENGAGGTDWGSIQLANGFARGQSEIGFYTVPTGFTAYVRELYLTVDSNKSATVLFIQRQEVLATAPPYAAWRVVESYDGVTGEVAPPLRSPLGPFPANTDIGFIGRVTSGTAAVSVSFEVLLIADP
jgi:hypothetical protein